MTDVDVSIPVDIVSPGDAVFARITEHLRDEGVIETTKVTELDLEVSAEGQIRVTHVQEDHP